MQANLSYLAAGWLVGIVLCATIRVVPALGPIILVAAAITTITVLVRGGVSEVGAYVSRIFAAVMDEPTFTTGLVVGIVLVILWKRHKSSAR